MSRRDKQLDKRVDNAFNAHCSGVQINILDLPKVFREGRRLIDQGVTDEELGPRLRSYVDTLKA